MGFWSDLFSNVPMDPRVAYLATYWPEDRDIYSVTGATALYKEATDKALAALGKMADIVKQTSLTVGSVGFGLSVEARQKFSDITEEMYAIVKRMAAYSKNIQLAGSEGYSAVKIPTFRHDVLRLMNLSAYGSKLSESQGGPSWFSEATLWTITVIVKTGLFVKKVGEAGVKVVQTAAEATIALLDNVDILMYGALGLATIWAYNKVR